MWMMFYHLNSQSSESSSWRNLFLVSFFPYTTFFFHIFIFFFNCSICLNLAKHIHTHSDCRGDPLIDGANCKRYLFFSTTSKVPLSRNDFNWDKKRRNRNWCQIKFLRDRQEWRKETIFTNRNFSSNWLEHRSVNERR